MDNALRAVIDGGTPFLLLHRPAVSATGVEVLTGDVHEADELAALPPSGPGPAHRMVVLVPYRQLRERGFDCHDDGAPLLAMTVRDDRTVDRADLLRCLPDDVVDVTGGGFDVGDDAYAATVRRIVDQEIGRGEGANFVIRRAYRATVQGDPVRAALTVFRRLLERETGAYWTFLLHTGSRVLVGATPERHASLADGRLWMTPISGTYRAAAAHRTVPGVLDFLADRKEIDELHMVVDEELKMMARVCTPGVRLHGPYLREMARLVHTEYLLSGPTSADVRTVLRETMFVPTVTGSPLQNACRVIKRYEPAGRGYYSGVLAVVGPGPALDSAVLIRTAELAPDRTLTIGVGATLVRHSDPVAETAETHAKTAALLDALRPDARPPARPAPALAGHPEVRARLAGRTATLAHYWRGGAGPGSRRPRPLDGRRILVVDGEDAFTAMLEHQLATLGTRTTIRGFDEPGTTDDGDVVVIGPGPGDPRDRGDRKVATLRSMVDTLLHRRRPLLAICLGHQVLCDLLGLEVVRKAAPHQGMQRDIDLFGERTRVGFYNTFAALAPADEVVSPRLPGEVLRVSRDATTGEVHALSGPGLRSVQFHPESLLTQHGVAILADMLTSLADGADTGPVRAVLPG
ncbi:anthranilate synthase family protein [Jidongwangia harbinensis]|uniref:anthranilate synthase family protein n=1 Tax=Jidongwangia harbinensis TaxID=2878561 RepID=UPI001CD951BD|nr:chorismate-binding protein [Jidongwangia harbinensis]MCA2218252.1 chorismate-binding protein [Jidongwangia harbinensis]